MDIVYAQINFSSKVATKQKTEKKPGDDVTYADVHIARTQTEGLQSKTIHGGFAPELEQTYSDIGTVGQDIPKIGTGRSWGESNYSCEEPWRLFKDKCYFLSEDKMNWNRSRDNCTSMHSHLVVIDSQEEQNFTSGVLPPNDRAWIGLTDQEEKGRWRWVNNKALQENQKYWQPNQPDNFKGKDSLEAEHCVVMYKGTNLQNWNDAYCSANRTRLCERPAVDLNA
ncbi:C-type lectin domain family 4 member D-like isoform X5 [Lepisosteus oculatus]|uniref:C-type lectin domain family 4 member D-like isoform X5 n=1 Tax=Lepisosteus oculatus TaxID=7918 RepID=UPI003720C86C